HPIPLFLPPQFGVRRFKSWNQPVQAIVDALPRRAIVELADAAAATVAQAVDAFISCQEVFDGKNVIVVDTCPIIRDAAVGGAANRVIVIPLVFGTGAALTVV